MTNTDELKQKRSAIEKGGGEEAIKQQHSAGKLGIVAADRTA